MSDVKGYRAFEAAPRWVPASNDLHMAKPALHIVFRCPRHVPMPELEFGPGAFRMIEAKRAFAWRVPHLSGWYQDRAGIIPLGWKPDWLMDEFPFDPPLPQIRATR